MIGSAVLLVVANLVPIAGVLFLGWDVAAILVLYWLENGIVGLLNVPKVLLAQGQVGTSALGMAGLERAMLSAASPQAVRFTLAPFFVVHYGMFWLVHGIFVFSLPFVWSGVDLNAPGFDFPFGALGAVVRLPPELLIAAAGLGLSHAASFALNYVGRREYLVVSPFEQMFRPYGRLVVLHVSIVLGGTLVAALGQPIGLLLVLVGVKTLLDVRFHMRERERVQGHVVSSPYDWMRT